MAARRACAAATNAGNGVSLLLAQTQEIARNNIEASGQELTH
jgi:hypothetical protein